jgi:hypothetical protein
MLRPADGRPRGPRRDAGGEALRTAPEFWLDLQRDHDLGVAAIEGGEGAHTPDVIHPAAGGSPVLAARTQIASIAAAARLA